MAASTEHFSNEDMEARIEAAAAVWLSLRDRGMSKAETAAFMQWLQEEPRHAEVFGELDRAWKDFDRLSLLRPADGEANPAHARDALAPRIRPRRLRPAVWIGSLAAVLLFTLILFGANRLITKQPTAETMIGALQKLDLADGSVVQLNTDSAIDVRFSETERRVRLIRGEAYFEVAKQPSRPFIVELGQVSVRAVGTAFNLRMREQSVEVLVTEGRVRVDTPASEASSTAKAGSEKQDHVLTAGERAIYARDTSASDNTGVAAQIEQIPAAEIARLLAWQERRLEFEAQPLANVVAEFNRYNRRKLVIDDPRLAPKRFSGVFRANEYGSFVQLLVQNFDVLAEQAEDKIILRLAE